MATDYISREAAKLAAVEAAQSRENGFQWGETVKFTTSKIIGLINSIPAADVVEVVRCRNCIHYDDRWKRCFYWGRVLDIHVIERGYCWRAERRAENG